MKKIIRVLRIIISICTIAGIVAFLRERLNTKDSVHKPYGLYESYIKRPLDCFLATGALIVLSPVLIIISLLVRIKLGSPVIFKQERPGKDEKIFTLYKFRTMTDARDEDGKLLPDAQRLTNFGKFLRATSLDELPELFSIAKGDMAIVGPRPLLTQYLPYYREEERERHAIRPGLTGYAQVHGRNYLMWDERMALDVEYARHITVLSDLKIILLTVFKVLKRSDVAEKRIVPLNQAREEEIKKKQRG